MISKVEVDILDSDNYETLHDKLSIAGRDLLNETLPNIFSSNISPENRMIMKLRLLVTYYVKMKRLIGAVQQEKYLIRFVLLIQCRVHLRT